MLSPREMAALKGEISTLEKAHKSCADGGIQYTSANRHKYVKGVLVKRLGHFPRNLDSCPAKQVKTDRRSF